MRRPTDQVLRGLKAMADAFDFALDRPPFQDLSPQAKRDVRAAIRWAWWMNGVREDRARIRALRAEVPDGTPWNPALSFPPYAPARRRRQPRG